MTLKEFQTTFAMDVFGQTKGEATGKKICIDCKQDMKGYKFPTDEDRKEYGISGMCPGCWDNTFKEE